MKRVLLVLLALGWTGAAVAAALHFAKEPPLPMLEVRTARNHFHFGRLLEAFPLRQGVRCPGPGLARVGLRVQALGGDAGIDDELELLVRADTPEGEVLRRATAPVAGLPRRGGFLSFEFEPLEDSRGRVLWLELRSRREGPFSSTAVWTRFRGQVVHERPWGGRTLTERELSGTFRALHPDLCALAFPMARLDPRTENARLRLFREGLEEPVVDIGLQPRRPAVDGYTLFRFPALPNSRNRTYRFELSLPEGSHAIGTDEGVSFSTAFGGSLPTEGPLLGVPAQDGRVDFVMRLHGERRSVLRRLVERLGRREGLALVLWFAAGVLLLLLPAGLRRARTGAGEEDERDEPDDERAR